MTLLLAALALTATGNAEAASAQATRLAATATDSTTLTICPGQISAAVKQQPQVQVTATAIVEAKNSIRFAAEPSHALASTGALPLGSSAGGDAAREHFTSADDRAMSGSRSLLPAVPGIGKPGSVAAANDTEDDLPAWPFALGTIAAVGAGALWAMRRRP